MYIGKRLEELRKKNHFSLSELAEKSGVQIATLSRIENMKMIGSLESHGHIAQALGVELSDLYAGLTPSGEKNPVEVGMDGSSSDLFVHSDRAAYELLTKNIATKKMMPVLVKLEPKGATTLTQEHPGTEKFVYVLNGRVDIVIGNQTYSLTPAHTLYFDAAKKHKFVNKGSTPVRLLSVITPVRV
ncbi:MAG: cupin domain-containing protein [Candidatus Omnitrophica bacterium]|nr:cupin domain-containing protein [Candidatus Omnitrophota bacterium]